MANPGTHGLRVTHEIDDADRITSADAAWWDFARENGGQALTPSTVLGRPLWDFVSGEAVRHLYRYLIERLRGTGSVLRLPYRCDAPDRRRFMELEVSRLPARGVRFTSRVLREEPREPVDLLAPAMERADWLIRMCAWCKRVEVDRTWVEIEEGVERLDLFGAARLPGITHGMCPACAADVRERVRRLGTNAGP